MTTCKQVWSTLPVPGRFFTLSQGEEENVLMWVRPKAAEKNSIQHLQLAVGRKKLLITHSLAIHYSRYKAHSKAK